MPNRSFTIECGPNTRNFTITQDGESREFQIATGVGPAGPAGSDADPYTLPIATDTTLGGIKSSTDILVDGDGVATVNYSLGGTGEGDSGKLAKYGTIGQLGISSQLIFRSSVIGTTSTIYNNDTSGQDYYLPDASGTIALTSDIPSLSGYQTTAGTLALGGFSSITGTIAVSNIASSTTLPIGVGSIELGHASDTTITRASAGTIAVEGVNVITTTTGDARYQPIMQGVVSTAQADATTTTPADVTGMTGVNLLADTWYRLEFSGQVTTTTGASWQIEMATSQNLARTSGTFGSINNAGNTAAGQVSFQSAQRVILTQRSTTGTAVPNYASFIFKTGSSAPTVKISFLQWTSPTGTASLLSGAAAVWTKLPM